MFPSAILCLALSVPVSAPMPFASGTWELSGTVALSTGNGTQFVAAGAPGYFLTPQQQLGGELVLDLTSGRTAVSLAPYYRYHFDVGSQWFVPYAGGLLGIGYEDVDLGGWRGSASDTWGLGQLMIGAKLMSGTKWSALAQLALRHEFDQGTDPYLNLSLGLSVYL